MFLASQRPLQVSRLTVRPKPAFETRLRRARPLQCLERMRPRRSVQAVTDQATQLHDANALGGDRHHHARQARARLSHLERVRGFRRAQLGGESVEPKRAAHPERVPAKLGPEPWIDEHALDYFTGALRLELVLGLVHHSPAGCSTFGKVAR